MKKFVKLFFNLFKKKDVKYPDFKNLKIEEYMFNCY
jgi:hypothetical protein